MRLFEWWSIPRKGWLIIMLELSVIIGLSSWVVTEYVNNVYFQSYVNGLAPVLVPVFSVAIGLASAAVATILYFGTRNVRRSDTGAEPSKKESQAKKPIRRSTVAEPKAKTAANRSGQQTRVKPVTPSKPSSRESNTSLSGEKKERS